jgi:hypothetical protein
MPVPTAAQGTTTIAGSVNVANTVANPVPVFNLGDALQPFQAAANSTQSGYNVSTVDIATVPAGYRLAIEFVSIEPPTRGCSALPGTLHHRRPTPRVFDQRVAGMMARNSPLWYAAA